MDDYYAEDMAMMAHIEASDAAYDAYLNSREGRTEMAAAAAFNEQRQYEEWVEMMRADDPDAPTSKDDWTDYLLAGVE